MRTVTVKFPGMRPAILAGAAGDNAWNEQQRQAEENLAEAAELLERARLDCEIAEAVTRCS